MVCADTVDALVAWSGIKCRQQHDGARPARMIDSCVLFTEFRYGSHLPKWKSDEITIDVIQSQRATTQTQSCFLTIDSALQECIQVYWRNFRMLWGAMKNLIWLSLRFDWIGPHHVRVGAPWVWDAGFYDGSNYRYRFQLSNFLSISESGNFFALLQCNGSWRP